MVLVKVNLGGTPVSLAMHLEQGEALAKSEFRFKSMPVKLEGAAKARMASFEGAQVEGAAFEVVPLLSSPSDMFSLGVLAIRGILVGVDFRCQWRWMRLMSLAKEAGEAGEGKLEEQISRLFATDPRWGKSLGPQRLTDEPVGWEI